VGSPFLAARSHRRKVSAGSYPRCAEPVGAGVCGTAVRVGSVFCGFHSSRRAGVLADEFAALVDGGGGVEVRLVLPPVRLADLGLEEREALALFLVERYPDAGIADRA
jgi:hypothetical protein